MSEDNIENLPSIEDLDNNSEELPSVDQFISEEKDLPSVEDFVEKEEIEEELKTDNWQDDYVPTEIETVDVIKAPQWGELVRMVNDVRESIPDIPEIKYYDNELKELSEHLEELKESIPEVPEVKYYDAEVQAICKQIDLVREEIQTLPEVKYYDEQLNAIEEKIQNLPEPKYYEGEIKSICEAIDEVRDQIPTFPKWVNEVNEVPDFSWIGKTFSIIDDDFVNVKDHLKDLKTQFDSDIHDLTENLDTKDFEKRVEIKEVSEHLNETKDKIYEEIKDATDRIWSHHKEFKDDDRKLKKSILSKLNETKQNIDATISESNKKYRSSNRELKDYFNKLQLEIHSLPEIKDYDDSIGSLKKNLFDLDKQYRNTKGDIVEIYKIVEDLKEQQTLTEQLLNEPPTYEQAVDGKPDPLTPLDKKFATVDDLSKHYTTFVNRVQQQLATFGGGGAVELQYLDDISGIATNISAYDGMNLVVDLDQTGVHKGKKFKFAVASGGSRWTAGTNGISTTSNVGIATTARSEYGLFVQGDLKTTGFLSATNGYFSGILTAHTFEHHTVTDIQSTGIITGMSNLDIRGDARIVGVLTVGSGSVTINGDTNILNVGTGITINATTNSIEVGGSKVADASGDANYTGVVTATAFDTTHGEVKGSSITTTSTSALAIVELSSSLYRSVNYQVQIVQGTNYNMTTINVIHDGTNTYMTEYGTINIPTGIATFSSDINSGSLRLLGYPASTNSTTFKTMFTAIDV
jgi:hypothetical protein